MIPMNPLLEQRLKNFKTKKDGWFKPETFVYILNPLFQTFLWFGALGWGAAASLYANDILDFLWPTLERLVNLPIHWPSVLFFGVGFVLAALFSLSRWVSAAQDRIVLDSMLTMPPHDFWREFGTNYAIASKLVDTWTDESLSAVENEESTEAELDEIRDDLTKSVRTILDSIIKLVLKWDSSNIRSNSVVYRANVMKVHYFGDSPDELAVGSPEAQELSKLAERFTTQPFASHYSGFVTLSDSQYTTTTESKSPEPDNRRPIAFPFTLNSAKVEQPIHANLLGAPKALASGNFSYVPNVDDIVSDYENNDSVVDKSVLANLKQYYGDKTIAHSILSIPLHDDENLRSKYVMSIYRNQDGLLFDGSKVNDFVEIVRPYSITLGRLIQTIDLFDELLRKREQE